MGFDFSNVPRALRPASDARSFVTTWNKIRKVIYSTRILQDLPPFAEKLGRAIWDIEGARAAQAVRDGDVAFFLACQMRLDQMDCAMVNAGRTIADRAPLTRSKFIVDGFREAAETQLKKLGGAWPPHVNDAGPAKSSG